MPDKLTASNNRVIFKKNIVRNYSSSIYEPEIGGSLYYARKELKEHCTLTLEEAYHRVINEVFSIE